VIHSTFTKNRDRLIEGGEWRASSLRRHRPAGHGVKDCCPRNNFSVDGTLIEAWVGGQEHAPFAMAKDDPPPPGRNPPRGPSMAERRT